MNEFEKNIFGYEPITQQLMEVCDMMKNPEIYEKLGAKPIKGILLYGPAGVGKSKMAECFCKESGRKTFTLRRTKNSKNFTDEIVKTFADAKMQAPSVIMLDDLDHFCPNENDDEEFTVVQGEIDELEDADVALIATANEYRRLPYSLRRTGRFDLSIHVPAPELKDAEKIIDFYLKDKAVGDDINTSDISKMLVGMTCSDLEEIINHAARLCGYDRSEKISMKYFVKAALLTKYETVEGYEEIDPKEKMETSLHEASHCCVAEVLQNNSIGLASILVAGRGERGGFVSPCEKIKRRPYDIMISLAGKAACEMYFPTGTPASGAQSDLERAMSLIRSGIANSGTLGLSNLDPSNDQFPKTSESYRQRNEALVFGELERYMFLTKKVLIENKEFLEKLRDALYEKGTLLHSEIQAIKASCKIVPIEI